MPIVNAIVLLTAYRGADVLDLPHEAPWYVQYFFNQDYGQKAFWLKQTDNDIIFDGEVSDWALYPEGSLNLADRTSTAQTAVDAMRRDRNINFSRFDMVIVVLGLNSNVLSDGGSTEVNVDGRRLRAIVSRVGDPFDFMAHEIGHGLGLNHSFGNVLFQTIGEGPGGYGHPHCIMSAMSYGFIPGGGPFVPASPRDGRSEYSRLGPSLNAVTALRRGWIHAHTFNIADGAVREFDIRSRHWGGRNPALVPQAVEIFAPNGNNYVIEFREEAGWDMGQDASYLIIAQDRGGIGDQAYPHASVGSYISQIRLPVTLGGLGHVRNFPGYGLQVINHSPIDHSLRIRLHPGKAPLIGVASSSSVETIERTLLESSTTTWEPGEKVCVEGTWRYEKVAQTQRATFEATCGDGYTVNSGRVESRRPDYSEHHHDFGRQGGTVG